MRFRPFILVGPTHPARAADARGAPNEPRERHRSGVFEVVPAGAHGAHLEPATVRCAAAYAVEQGFTSRERDVFLLMISGLGTKEIAAQIGIAHATVRTHCLHMREKSGCTSDRAIIAHFARTTAERGCDDETEREPFGGT